VAYFEEPIMKIPEPVPVTFPAQVPAEKDKVPVDLTNGYSLAGKKVAIFIQSLTIGGAERMALNLVEGLVERGIRVDLLLADHSGALLSRVPPQVKVVDLKGKRVLFSLLPLVHYLRDQSPDILYAIQTHTSLIAIWAAMLSRVHAPVVISQHNVLTISQAAAPTIRNRSITILARWFFRYADAAICVSQGVAEDLIESIRMPRQKTHVVYNPVISPELEQKALETITNPWFAQDAPPVILAVGRLTSAKDYPTLLRAFAILSRKQPAHLLILGEGKERANLEALVSQLGLKGNVQMPGFVENPHAYMARARLFVLSSRWEGFGNVLVEALACGTPVVATDCRSGPGEILEAGRYGRLVPVGDVEALAVAIVEALQATPDRALLRQRAQNFTLDESVRKYIRIFESCLSSYD
jgi:glycosyltransferase involved in cell wall biosynthesis